MIILLTQFYLTIELCALFLISTGQGVSLISYTLVGEGFGTMCDKIYACMYGILAQSQIHAGLIKLSWAVLILQDI